MKLPVAEIMEMIPTLRPSYRCKVEIMGKPIKVSGRRMQTFKQCGTTCAECGVEASHWEMVETLEGGWKLKLMAEEVEMTQDHIYPKSRGGSNDLWNAQTMCYVCNHKKSSYVEDPAAVAELLCQRLEIWESKGGFM